MTHAGTLPLPTTCIYISVFPPGKKWSDKWWGDVWEAFSFNLGYGMMTMRSWPALYVVWCICSSRLSFESSASRFFFDPVTLHSDQHPESSDDIGIQIICDPSYLKVPVALKHNPLGYRVQINRTGLRCFSQEKADAISKLKFIFFCGVEYFIPSFSRAARGPSIPCFFPTC